MWSLSGRRIRRILSAASVVIRSLLQVDTSLRFLVDTENAVGSSAVLVACRDEISTLTSISMFTAATSA